jgi:hypothetical protein
VTCGVHKTRVKAFRPKLRLAVTTGPIRPLPIELYRPICMSVEGKKHLCAIARTSRTLQVEAERLIYRMLAFGQADHVVKLCRLICAVPRLGPYVQLLFCYDRFLVGLAVLGRLLSSAVGRMPNLRCWITANSSYRSNWHSIWTPHHRYPFQLSFPEAHHAPRRNLLAFLETQSSIRELILELGVDDQLTNNQDIVIPPSMVPNLVHLEARLCQNNPLPFHLLPGRPVTHFAIDHLHPMLLRNLSLSVGPLKALRLNGGASYIGPTTLLLPEFAPHLEVISGIGLYILGTVRFSHLL